MFESFFFHGTQKLPLNKLDKLKDYLPIYNDLFKKIFTSFKQYHLSSIDQNLFWRRLVREISYFESESDITFTGFREKLFEKYVGMYFSDLNSL